MGKVIQMPGKGKGGRRPAKPKTFTTPEMLIEQVRQEMFGTGESYRVLAVKAGVSASTIANLMNGKTRWPRPTTLGPLLGAMGVSLGLYNNETGERLG